MRRCFFLMPSSPSLKNAAIVVSSCDAYSDLWPLFFHFFFKHWSAPCMPVYLISNHRCYKDERVIPVRVGPDTSWSDNLIRGLEHIPEENLFVWLDDFLVNRDFQSDALAECLAQLDRAGGRYLAVDQHGEHGESMPGWLRRIEAGNLRAGMNLSLWKKCFLRELLQPGCSIWAAESHLRKLNREGTPGLYYMKQEAPVVVSYVESVKGQFWQPGAMKFLHGQGIRWHVKRRPFPPQERILCPRWCAAFGSAG
jgi:hypothetical protein